MSNLAKNLSNENDVVKSECLCSAGDFQFDQWLFAFNSFADRQYLQNGDTSSKNAEEPSEHKKSSQPKAEMSDTEKYDAKKSIVILIAIFLTSIAAMFYVYLSFPELEEWVFIELNDSTRTFKLTCFVSELRRNTSNCHGILKMPSSLGRFSIGTRTCTISRSCLPSSCSTYCILSKWHVSRSLGSRQWTLDIFLNHSNYFHAACKHSPFQDHYSCRFCRDSYSSSRWRWHWFAHVQPSERHCAICCHNWWVAA